MARAELKKNGNDLEFDRYRFCRISDFKRKKLYQLVTYTTLNT
jgi:hypothetical protein